MGTRVDKQNSRLWLGNDPTEFTSDITKIGLTGDDKDDLSFGDIQSGDVTEFTLAISLFVVMQSGGLWLYLWQNAGDEVPFYYAPYGNDYFDESGTSPVFSGTAKIVRKPPVESEAAIKGKTTVDVELTCTVTPNLDSSGISSPSS